MIYQNAQTENTQNQFSDAIRELQIGKLLRKANITKNCGIPAYEVFQFLLLLVFQGKNLFRFLNSKHKDQAVSKNTYYRFLNECTYNWKKFLFFLSAKVISAFDRLTRPERVKVFVLDDSVVKRNRSRKVELLARVYDHVEHKFQKGFTLLTLGWSDGYSLVPVGFNLLSSAAKSNRYQEISDDIDHRSNGYKTRKESLLAKTDAAIMLIQRALNAGISADYVLMDTWFTTEPMIRSILAEGLDVIGMVKQLKQPFPDSSLPASGNNSSAVLPYSPAYACTLSINGAISCTECGIKVEASCDGLETVGLGEAFPLSPKKGRFPRG